AMDLRLRTERFTGPRRKAVKRKHRDPRLRVQPVVILQVLNSNVWRYVEGGGTIHASLSGASQVL
ncbi:MAG: hypothetical protein KDE47_02835, partial [Caldilineaceae bacterium]|nr:hypothetical protein [Caldilineaceae bacterium]